MTHEIGFDPAGDPKKDAVIYKLVEPVEIYESDFGLVPIDFQEQHRKFTERLFHLSLERIYWREKWTWWKRLKFEIWWLVRRFR